MPEIRPSSELRGKFSEIEKYVKITGEPVFITSRGRSSMVLLSHEKYEELTGEKTVLETPSLTGDEMKQFGMIIRNLRACKDMDIGDLAEKSGIDYDRIVQFENGQCVPTSGEVSSIADCLDVNAGTLEFFIEPGKSGVVADARNFLAGILNKIAGKIADD